MPPTFTHKKMMAVLLSCTNIICRVRIQTSCDLEHPIFFISPFPWHHCLCVGIGLIYGQFHFHTNRGTKRLFEMEKGEVLHLIYIYINIYKIFTDTSFISKGTCQIKTLGYVIPLYTNLILKFKWWR